MMRYSDLQPWAKAAMDGLGHTDVLWVPGPPTASRLMQKTPNAFILLSIGGGAAPTHEMLFDQPFILARVVGRQNDLTSAETLAFDLDRVLLSVDRKTLIGTANVLNIWRTGGPPGQVSFDDAERYQYQTTYITEVQR